jgi:hypothetical protein
MAIFIEAALASDRDLISLTLSVCIACACVSTSLAPVPVPVPVCLLCIRHLPSLYFSPAWSFGCGPSFQLQTVVYSHLLTIVAPRSLAAHVNPSSKQSKLFRSDPQALVRHLSRRANEINNQLYEFVHLPMHAPGWENKMKHILEVAAAHREEREGIDQRADRAFDFIAAGAGPALPPSVCHFPLTCHCPSFFVPPLLSASARPLVSAEGLSVPADALPLPERRGPRRLRPGLDRLSAPRKNGAAATVRRTNI